MNERTDGGMNQIYVVNYVEMRVDRDHYGSCAEILDLKLQLF